ncbi:hypothetical protein AB833_18710 [Chromatiales bacterium (ex Bugula neritina AB1)]|nr:hypothetical protein AB833_18710 [Chromatiales bacterium (ex Bugula neritina AB1)]
MQETWYENSPFRPINETVVEQQWRDAIEKTLSGQRFEDELISTTLDQIEISPLYHQSTTPTPLNADQKNWHIAQSFCPKDWTSGELSTLNTEILDTLSGGVTAIELDASCDNLGKLDQLLTDVYPEMIQLSLAPSANNLNQAAVLEALWRSRSLPAETISGGFNIDPLAALALNGKINGTQAYYRQTLGELACHTHKHLPNVRSLCVDTSPYHNGGASEAQELGFALATGTEYLRDLTSAGLDINDAIGQITWRFALDSDFFLSIAKLRAARVLWLQVLSHCEAQTSEISFQLDSQSGKRSLSVRDPWVNILRVTSQAFAAMIGGASGFMAAAYDANLPEQSRLGQRIARNTQLMLLEESHIRAVADPLRGSGFIEQMTQQLSAKAWAVFQTIEQQGGMWASLQSGLISRLVAEKRETRQQALALGDTAIVGVTEYPDLDDQLPSENTDSIYKSSQPESSAGTTSTATPATQADKVTALLDGDTCRNWSHPIHNHSVTAPAVSQFRDAGVFESMVARSQQYERQTGAPPCVQLITLGNASDYTARLLYSRNFFAVAGINSETRSADDLTDLHLAGSRLIVLCSSNRQYATAGVETCKALSASSDSEIWLAGFAGKLEAQLQDNGMTQQIHTRCNKVELLNRALDILVEI